MALTDATLIRVTATYTQLDGNPAKGKVFFSSSQVLINNTSNEIIEPVDFVAELDSSGSVSIDLPATDDPDFSPTGWVYKVTEQTTGGNRPMFNLSLPHDGGAVDLADVAPPGPTADVSTAEYTLLETFTAHREAWGGDPPSGGADDLLGLDANNLPKIVPSDTYQQATYRDIRLEGAVADGSASAVQATRDALASYDRVIITGGTYFFDGQVDVSGNKELHIAADATVLVQNGYTGIVFRLIAPQTDSTNGESIPRPWITGTGTIIEDNVSPGRQHTWVGVECFADGSAEAHRLTGGGVGLISIYHPERGLRLHADDALGNNAFITGMTFMPFIDFPVIGVEFDRTNGGYLGSSLFLGTLVQTRSSITTHGFKDVQGNKHTFLRCIAWDSDVTGAQGMNILAGADGTTIIGPGLKRSTVDDQGTNTVHYAPDGDNFIDADSDVWLTASELDVSFGTPTLSNTGEVPYWLLASDAQERVGGNIDPTVVMEDWATFDVLIYWTNAGTGTGGAAFRFDFRGVSDGADLSLGPTSSAETVLTAPSQNIASVDTIATGQTVPSTGMMTAAVIRKTGNAGDDLANDVGLIAVVLRKAS